MRIDACENGLAWGHCRPCPPPLRLERQPAPLPPVAPCEEGHRPGAWDADAHRPVVARIGDVPPVKVTPVERTVLVAIPQGYTAAAAKSWIAPNPGSLIDIIA
jgi:hypothetical protein